MIKSGMTVLYKNGIYRVRSVVDYKPYALAWLNTGIYVPVENLSKLNEF
ncbi:MAG: hypothetical protein LKJ22_08500 [Liquorilactobacillus nagelii]|jgi:hypothetical protein|nr:hypothetical protein [Liquorilactobacillus nagelii]MCI1921946.1 hypothetical protein [Liquorilactobacillus nagelii]MCI1976406.1 hypothetical protein [Liquorilactobacillus nagelii]